MRKILALPVLLLAAALCSASESISCKIEGWFTGSLQPRYVYLRTVANPSQGTQLIYVPVKDGHFTITGTFKYPEGDYCGATLFNADVPGLQQKDLTALFKKNDYDSRYLVLEKEISITITDLMRESVVTGSKLNQISNLFESISAKEKKQYDSIQQWYDRELKNTQAEKAAAEKAGAEYSRKLLMMQNENTLQRIGIIEQYPDSRICLRQFATLSFLNSHVAGRFQERMEKAWQKIPERLKKEPEGIKAGKELSVAGKNIGLKEGDSLPGYTFTGEDGKPVSTTEFRGKYLLLDFWTSWCGPCRAEHFNMKKVFEKYSNRNFVILQVSLDTQKEKWLKALKEDNLPWRNLLSTNGWDKNLEKVFSFNSVPSSYLAGPDGKIIARNLRGDELERTLQAIFGF